ncbi:hypothetical protein ACEQPO_11045 [Bacillus sp. SL00103]
MIKHPALIRSKKVADYFDVSIDYLLGRAESPIETAAYHHDGEEWTTEELGRNEKFLQFIKSKRTKSRCSDHWDYHSLFTKCHS